MVARLFRSRNGGVRPNLNLSAVVYAACLFLFYLSASVCSSEAQTSSVAAVLPDVLLIKHQRLLFPKSVFRKRRETKELLGNVKP